MKDLADRPGRNVFVVIANLFVVKAGALNQFLFRPEPFFSAINRFVDGGPGPLPRPSAESLLFS
jgi:hypothetical protein